MFRAFIFAALVATGFAIFVVSAPFALGFSLHHHRLHSGSFGWFGQVVGTGDVVNVSRSVEPFHKIVVNGSTDIHVIVGGERSVVVEAQKNIADIIETSVDDGALVVSSQRSYTSRHNTLVRVTVPELDGIALHGSSDATVNGVRGSRFDVSIRGSGDLTASGDVERLTYSSSGSGDARLHDLLTRDAVVKIRGSGNAALSVASTLDVDISGSGDVTYSGSPKIVHQSIRGSGSVSQR